MVSTVTKEPLTRMKAARAVFATLILFVVGALPNLARPRPAYAATGWQTLAHSAPFAASTALLLTDGTVMVQEGNGKRWARLTPDAFGSYQNGTWTMLPQMNDPRLYYASAVLGDGRVVVAGGEYHGGNTAVEFNGVEIYDPVANAWHTVAPPSGWSTIGDAPCSVLANGKFLLGNSQSNQTRLLDPATETWAVAGSKADSGSEESWALLPDGTVVTAECQNHPQAEKYLPASDTWVSAGTVPGDLVEASSIEIGSAILLPSGSVFALGATGRSDSYTPPAVSTDPGTWTAGPNMPLDGMGRQLGTKDTPAALLPNGHILTVAAPVDGVRLDYLGPTSFLDYDGTTFSAAPSSGNEATYPYDSRMLLLPTGQALYTNTENGTVAIYTPSGGPDPSWRPQITSVSNGLLAGGSYVLQGRQLNGLSQANGYGDDASSATNYPLVRIRNLGTGHVFYARTFDHSTMGVATGPAIVSTHFTVPAGIEGGASELVVVANGIESPAQTVYVGCQVIPPSNIAVGNDPNLCGAVVSYPAPVTIGPCGTVTCTPASGSFFPVGVTTVTCTTAAGPSATFTVTVVDSQAPTVSHPDVTVPNDPNQCGAKVSYAPPMVSDNCPGVTYTCSPLPGTFFPVGTTPVTCTAVDAAGNTTSSTFNVTVNDVEPPVISGAAPSVSQLWPPNHKMVDVTIAYTATDNCGVAGSTLAVTSNEPVNGLGDGNTAPDWEVVDAHHIRLRAERAGRGSGRVYTVTITVTDIHGNRSSTAVTVTVPKSRGK